MVCVCWLVVCSTLEEDITVVDEVNSDAICPSVVENSEDGDGSFVNNVVSTVVPLSIVDDSNVDVPVGDIPVANVD